MVHCHDNTDVVLNEHGISFNLSILGAQSLLLFFIVFVIIVVVVLFATLVAPVNSEQVKD